MAIRLLDIEQQTLKNFRLFIRIENFQLGAFQFRSIDHLHPAVDPDRTIVTGYKNITPT